MYPLWQLDLSSVQKKQLRKSSIEDELVIDARDPQKLGLRVAPCAAVVFWGSESRV